MRFLALAPLLTLLGCSSDRIAQLEKENRELRVELESVKLDSKERCSRQARIEYEALGWKEEERKGTLVHLTNHFNTKTRTCFMLIDSIIADRTGALLTMGLMDAFEGKSYAKYAGKGNNLVTCKVTLSTGKESDCHSSDEFDSLVNPYMEE